ncbi:MAG TPA: MFS transporter, partial [Candidatus Acidoferrum sp.]|nr:MFS transporter [Candidatus Acidoferrum sp.]
FAEAGLLSNFPFVGGFLTIAAAGWAVDAFGDRIVMVLGGIVAGVAALLCAVAPTLSLIMVALLFMGAGIMMPTPAGSIAVRSAFALRFRGMVMSIRQTGIPLGGFFAALFLPWIALSAGWRAAIVAAGAASIAVALIGLAAYRSRPKTVQRAADSGSLRQVLTRDIRVAAASGLFLVSSQICLLTYLVVYLIHDRSQSVTTAAFFLAMAQLAGAAGRVFWGVVSDRLMHGRRRPALLMAATVGAVASLALAVMPASVPIPLLVVAILACAVGAVGWNGVQISYISELAKPGTEGRSVGLGLMIQQPGILIGPFLFGLVVDMSGSFRLAWLLVAGFMGAAMLIMMATREMPRITQHPPAAESVA